jgi:serine/threonine-protein kinase
VPDELFARVVVQKDFASLGALRECLGIPREQDPGARQRLSVVMVQEGILGRRDVEAVEEAARSGAVRDKRIGAYELLGMIGEGGMGAVYAAVDVDTLDFCALKILPKELAEDDDIVRRFLQEAETACTLRHPNIVGGIRVGEDQGLHFFSMAFVDGVTVYDRLEDEGVLPEGESLRLVRGTCLGLQYASEKGLVHRDIKPENIMIDRDGTPKLLDMGLVKRLDAGHGTRLTQTGMAIGTPHYISPEQARGEEKVDPRSDIYALGATLYHMVTGQVPFEGNTAAVIMTKHLNEELDYPSDVNPEVSEHTSRLISKMMAKARHNRYARPKDIVADIDLILTGKAPSGDMLPAGASTIRQAVQIERVKQKVRRAGVTSVHARIEKRERGGLPELLARHRKPLTQAGIALGILSALLLVLRLVSGTAPEPEPNTSTTDDAHVVPAEPAAAKASPVEELVDRLRTTAIDKLPEVFDALPEVTSLSSEDAQTLAAAVEEAAERFDGEAERRLQETLARAKADPASRKAVLAELRKLRVTFEQSLAVTKIDEAIAGFTPRPQAPKPKPPKAAPVDLAAMKGLRGWHTYGNWVVENGALVFTFDPGKKYDRAAQSIYGFGVGRVTAEIKTVGGTRAEVAVWDQATSDRKNGAPSSVAAALAKGNDLSPAQRLFAKLEINADPRDFSVKLGGRKLPTHVEGPLRSGRVRFSLTGGKWWIRNLKIEPPSSSGRAAYAVDFMKKGHGWSGRKVEKGLAATTSNPGGEVWLTSRAGALFTVADAMRLAFVFRAERVKNLLVRMESTDGRRWEFRLSGRPVEERWSELALRLKDLRTDRGGTPYPGARVKQIAVGATGLNPELVLTSLRVGK